ncbi:hypothetical protein [Streptomyces sp. LN500]|uniref:hypothetical protein n=1 Tax=Streptomyces sp. LN500 TaxID=3112978 RepID=UPI00371955EE
MQIVEVEDMTEGGPSRSLGQAGRDPLHGVATRGQCNGHRVLECVLGQLHVIR